MSFDDQPINYKEVSSTNGNNYCVVLICKRYVRYLDICTFDGTFVFQDIGACRMYDEQLECDCIPTSYATVDLYK